MKTNIAMRNLSCGYFVLKLDGRVKSQHRRLADALRAALQLKDQFPQHDIKVRAPRASAQLKPALNFAW
jgi:hypothetical protein